MTVSHSAISSDPAERPTLHGHASVEDSKYEPSGHGNKEIGLRTLGDGPIAPTAADEAAAAEDTDLDIEISPGRRGWLNLVGVSDTRSRRGEG
jgi:hypothetical protein